jgi:hypothetical protein
MQALVSLCDGADWWHTEYKDLGERMLPFNREYGDFEKPDFLDMR